MEIKTVADAYFLYVVNMGLSESLFWDADISFLQNVAENQSAYNGWMNAELEWRRKD